MKKIRYYILTSLMTAGLTSCELFSDFGDLNDNPAATTTPIVGALLTNVQAGLGNNAFMITPGYFCQYFSETQYSSTSLYSNTQSDFSGIYTGTLYDLENIVIQDQSNSMSAVAKILQQYIYWTVTDRWGDVPYSEALQGASVSRPKYDTQEEIYKGMIQALKDANAKFDASIITGDVVYGGDAAAWKRTANTMRMLIALQLSNKYPAAGGYAATEFNAALNDPAGIITTNAQNFKLSYPGGNFSSTYWGLYNGRRDVGESATMTALMGSLNDTRQNAFGGATHEQGIPATSQPSDIGVPYGLERSKAEAFTSANPTWARVLRGNLRSETSPVYILTASQAFLARAEAADLGWTSENLSEVYRKGIELSFEQWGIASPANSYFAQASVAVTAGGADNKKNIATQRYIAHYPDGLQGWNIWRKTGYPRLTPAPDAVNTTKQIPHRYLYGAGESTSNKENVDEAMGRVGSYTQDAKVWWE